MVHTYCLLFDPCVLNAYTMRRVDVRAFPPCGANSIQVAQVVHGFTCQRYQFDFRSVPL